MRLTKIFAVSALVLAMSACSTTMPNTQSGVQADLAKVKDSFGVPPKAGDVLAEPNVPLTESYKTGINDKETASTPTAPSVAATAWKDYYADEKLKALIALGLANNKSLEQQILAVQKTKVAYQIQDVADLPTVSASGGYTRSGNKSDSTGRYSVGLGMSSYEFDFWGKISSLKEQALQTYLATAASKDSAQISLIANIANAYVNISYAKAQLYLAESTVTSRERSLFIAQKRFEAGVDSKTPSLQAEASLDTARLSVLTAQTSLNQAINALQLLIGGAVPEALMPEAAVTDLVNPKLINAGLPSELLYHRPDIAAAEYNLKAAGANINNVRATFFPSISLTSNVGLGSTKLTDLFKSGAFSWSISPSINLPLFDAGQRKSNYKVAELDQKSKLAAYEYAIQAAFSEVNDVLATRATIGKQLEVQYRLQDNTQETYNIAYATFRSGLDNYLNVLDAERSLFSVQQSILNLEKQRIASQISLYQTLGGGASLDAGQITKKAETQEQAMTAAQILSVEQAKDIKTDRSPVTPKQVLEQQLADGVKSPALVSPSLNITPVKDGVPSVENESQNEDSKPASDDGQSDGTSKIAIPSALTEQPATQATAAPVAVPTATTAPVIKRTANDDDSPIKSLLAYGD